MAAGGLVQHNYQHTVDATLPGRPHSCHLCQTTFTAFSCLLLYECVYSLYSYQTEKVYRCRIFQLGLASTTLPGWSRQMSAPQPCTLVWCMEDIAKTSCWEATRRRQPAQLARKAWWLSMAPSRTDGWMVVWLPVCNL